MTGDELLAADDARHRENQQLAKAAIDADAAARRLAAAVEDYEAEIARLEAESDERRRTLLEVGKERADLWREVERLKGREECLIRACNAELERRRAVEQDLRLAKWDAEGYRNMYIHAMQTIDEQEERLAELLSKQDKLAF